jgi:hypothetical protein
MNKSRPSTVTTGRIFRRPLTALADGNTVEASRTSQEPAQFVCRHADDAQDVPQRALRHVPAGMYRYYDAPAIGMSHHVVASTHSDDLETGALKSPD